MGRSFLSIILSLCLVISCAASQGYQELSKSVRKLHTTDGMCSAWALSAHTWVTAAHCTDGPLAVIGDEEVVLVKRDEKRDLALYLAEGEAVPLPIAPDAPSIGTEVMILGFPRDSETPLTLFGHIMGGSFKELPRRTLLDAPSGPGASGAPVLHHGKVVGVLAGGSQNVPLLSYMVSHRDLEEFVR